MISRRNLLRSSAGAAVALSMPSGLLAVEPLKDAAPGGPVNLSSNENAYGPLPGVYEEMVKSLKLVNRYPDWHYDELWAELGKLHNVKPEQITLGCGSGDILRTSAEALCTRTKTIVQASPTFELLALYHRRTPGAKVEAVKLRDDHSHDLIGMLDKAQAGADLIYICNPNNPTASITPRAEIESFIAKLPKDTYVMIDEAYHHFAEGSPGYVSFLDKPIDDPRVFVLRTFSKIFGMAGLRVGYVVGPQAIVDQLTTYHVFDNPNVVGVRAAITSLRANAAKSMAAKRNAADRDKFNAEAARRNIKVIPSYANFVMMETGRPIKDVIEHFKKNNVLIGRPFPPYETMARISLGLPAEMTTFWKVWDQLPRVQ